MMRNTIKTLSDKDLKQRINEYVISAILLNKVNSRKEIEQLVAEKFDVTVSRSFKTFFSVISKNSKRPIRLKGGVYEKGADFEAIRKSQGFGVGEGSNKEPRKSKQTTLF